MMTFETLGLNSQILKAVQDLGYENPTGIQERAIPPLLAGKDILGQAQTGTGKTAAFVLPIIHNLDFNNKAIQALVLTPTRELAIQISEATQQFGKYSKVEVLPVYGGQSYTIQLKRLKQGVHIVVGTPGRMLDLIHRGALDLSHLRFLVLDEADEMLEMGFLEEVEEIIQQTPPQRQAAFFSATLPKSIREMAGKYLNQPEEVLINKKKLTVDQIAQCCYFVRENDKIAALTRLFEVETITSALIFTRTKLRAAELAEALTDQGHTADALHGDMKQASREQVMGRFRKGKATVLVATDVAARGLDVQDVSHVINFDVPLDPEDYVHRIGRTGRAGKSGTAITLVTPGDQRRLRQIEAYISQPISRAKLPDVSEIMARRNERFIDTIVERLALEKFSKKEVNLVQQIVDFGYDSTDVAAALVQMLREEENQRPLEEIRAVSEERRGDFQKSPRSGKPSGAPFKRDKRGHEQGMVRFSINLGRSDSIQPGQIVGAIAGLSGIPGSAIGAIDIHQQKTFLDVSEKYVDVMLKKMGSWKSKGRPVIIQRDRAA